MSKVYIGVDGGGTKTLTVCVDNTHGVVGRYTSGCTNHNSVGDDAAKKHLSEGILGVLAAASRSISEVGGIVLSVSGVDRPKDKQMVQEWLDELLPNVPAGIHNDAVAALASGTKGVLRGIVVISGTGMIAYGFKDGAAERAGGWGPLLGDQGSGYDIGLEVLKAIMRAKDGAAAATKMTQKVLSSLQLQKEEELISWVYAKHDEGWQRIAKVAAFAHECAREGDNVANRVLEDAAAALVATIETVAKKIDFDKEEEYPLIMAGGNLDHEGSLLTEKLIKQLHAHLPRARPSRPVVDPAMGAALLAVNIYAKQ